MDYLAVFLQMLHKRNLTDNTIRSYSTYIKPYLAYLDSLSISPPDASWQVMGDFLDWIQQRRSLSALLIPISLTSLPQRRFPASFRPPAA